MIFGNVSTSEDARTIFDFPVILELVQLIVSLWVSFTFNFNFMSKNSWFFERFFLREPTYLPTYLPVYLSSYLLSIYLYLPSFSYFANFFHELLRNWNTAKYVWETRIQGNIGHIKQDEHVITSLTLKLAKKLLLSANSSFK